jgi:archaeosine-15-forming tRNA-guanine transglycosylase
MKPKFRVILEQAIEEGVRRGYSLAHKHVENPSEGAIIERIEDAVMSAIYEYFTFEEDE